MYSLTICLWLHKSIRFSFFFEFLPVRTGNFDSFKKTSIRDTAQSAHGAKYCWIDDVLVFIDGVFSGPETNALNDS